MRSILAAVSQKGSFDWLPFGVVDLNKFVTIFCTSLSFFR